MKENDTKCAPSKKYENKSCFTLSALKNIAKAYNEEHEDDKINIVNNKTELVDMIDKKMKKKYKCDKQTCWTRQDFLENLDEEMKEDIMEKTFRPLGPSKKYGWLSTSHINEVIDQYHDIHKEFVFLGAVPYDFDDLKQLEIYNLDFSKLKEEGKSKIGMVINLDEHYKSGSHWVALYTDLDKNQIYYFDSVGKPPKTRIRKFVNRITKFLYKKKYKQDLYVNDILKEMKQNNANSKVHNKKINNNQVNSKYVNNIMKGGFDIRYNHIQHQFENSECGVYSINFIIRLVKGESFDSIINNVIKDDIMNMNREKYFRNETS
jgi:hypothetical protein